MKRKSISHIVKKQIKQALREQIVTPIISNNKSVSDYRQDLTQSNASEETNNKIIPFLDAVLGDRIFTGYRVVRTEACTGMQVYIFSGSAFFDINKYVESINGKFFTIVGYEDDQWVYVYLTKDGEIISNKYSPIISTNEDYIPLAMIWVETGSTEINPKFIVDIRPNRVASLAEIYGIRSQQAELYNIIPNSLVGIDDVELTDASESGEVRIHIQPNTSALIYMQGHIIILPEDTLTLELPESGSQDYYIVAHGYIDNSELIYKIDYKQIESTETVERYQLVLGKISGLTSETIILTEDMIDIRMQRSCEDILEVPFKFIFKREGILSEESNIDVAEIVPETMKIITTKVYLGNSMLESGDIDSIIIDVKINGVSIFEIESEEEHRIQIPKNTPNGTLLISGDIDQNKIYLEENDIVTVDVIDIPYESGNDLPEDLIVIVECVVSTQRPII